MLVSVTHHAGVEKVPTFCFPGKCPLRRRNLYLVGDKLGTALHIDSAVSSEGSLRYPKRLRFPQRLGARATSAE